MRWFFPVRLFHFFPLRDVAPYPEYPDEPAVFPDHRGLNGFQEGPASVIPESNPFLVHGGPSRFHG